MEELFYQVIILALIVWAFVATVLSIIFYKKWIKRQKSAFKLGESKIK